MTRKAGERPEPGRLTQVGRALKRLGIEHILAYSPQARGRSERVNRTLQDRLVNELRVHGIRSLERANRYLIERFVPAYNAEFGKPPADTTTVFVPLGETDLDTILCHEEERAVGKDNTVQLDGVRLQIDKQPGRVSCAGLAVTVRRHLNGTHTVLWGKRCLGRYDHRGRRLEAATAVLFATAAVGTWVSIRWPVRARRRGITTRGDSGLGGIAMLAGTVAAAALVGGTVWAARTLAGPAWAGAAGLATGAVYLAAAAGTWWISLERNASALVANREKLIETIARVGEG